MHPAIRVSRESARGCGFRKKGGLYLVAQGEWRGCGKLPLPLHVCPVCSSGIKPSRGWTWINGTVLFADVKCKSLASQCSACPLSGPVGRIGLLWIGGKFYNSPDAWTQEANERGVSRRIAAVPKDFKLGETWVALAHREGFQNPDGSMSPAVFQYFKPTAIEKVVEGDEPEEEIEALLKRGISPVKVERIGDKNGQEEPDDLFSEEEE